MTFGISCIPFTDVTRATVDGSDGWENCWDYHGEEYPQRIRGQQQKGGDGIIGDRYFSTVSAPE